MSTPVIVQMADSALSAGKWRQYPPDRDGGALNFTFKCAIVASLSFDAFITTL